MKCSHCGQDAAREIKTAETVKLKNGDYLVIDNIPMITCKNCGEAYFSAKAMKMMEEIETHPERTVEKTVRYATL